MKPIFATMMIFLLIAGTLATCQGNTTNTVAINEQDAGKTIELKAGDTLVISLDGNMTTGFSWIPVPKNPVVLEQVGDVAVTPVSDAVGAPGKIVLQFKATTKGQTNLHLDYKRSWEQGVNPEKTFEVTVIVK